MYDVFSATSVFMEQVEEVYDNIQESGSEKCAFWAQFPQEVCQAPNDWSDQDFLSVCKLYSE